MVHGQAHRQRIGIAHALRRRGVDAVLHHGSAANTVPVGDGLADDDVIPGQHLAAARRSRCARDADASGGRSRPCMSSSRLHSVRTGASSPAARAALAIAQASTTTVAGAAKRRPKPPPAICTLTCDLLRLEAERGRAAAPRIEPGASGCPSTSRHGRPTSRIGAVQRLHGRVGEIGKHELGIELAGRGGQRRHVGVELARAGAAGQLAVLGQLLARCRPSRRPMYPIPA